jgi:hypothetical protein
MEIDKHIIEKKVEWHDNRLVLIEVIREYHSPENNEYLPYIRTVELYKDYETNVVMHEQHYYEWEPNVGYETIQYLGKIELGEEYLDFITEDEMYI